MRGPAVAFGLTLLLAGCAAKPGSGPQGAATPSGDGQAAAMGPGGRTTMPATPAPSLAVLMADVCFPTTNPPDAAVTGVPQAELAGTRFGDGRSATAILLVSGGGHPRQYWDHDDGTTVARRLAAAGYTVFTYDRLGYLGSHENHYFVGLTATQHADMFLDVIDQVRHGTYGVVSSALGCVRGSGPGFTHLVLVGQSLGALYSIDALETRPDVADAVIVGEFALYGMINPLTAPMLARPLATADLGGYVSFPADESDRVALIFYLPGVDPSVVDAYCHPILEGNMPSGEYASMGELESRVRQGLSAVRGDLPVLFVWGDHSFPFGGAGEQEMQQWSRFCPCASHLSSWTQLDSGHDFNLHRSSPTFSVKAIDWLGSLGLRP